jgi:hypothetical protein
MAIKHIILLFVETPNFFVLKARRRAGRVVDRELSIILAAPYHRIKIHIEGPLTSEALKFLSSRMSHYACWPPFS